MTTRLKSFFSDKYIYIAVFCLLLLHERRAFSIPYRGRVQENFWNFFDCEEMASATVDETSIIVNDPEPA